MSAVVRVFAAVPSRLIWVAAEAVRVPEAGEAMTRSEGCCPAVVVGPAAVVVGPAVLGSAAEVGAPVVVMPPVARDLPLAGAVSAAPAACPSPEATEDASTTTQVQLRASASVVVTSAPGRLLGLGLRDLAASRPAGRPRLLTGASWRRCARQRGPRS
jgi:hypothetical protein